MKMKHKVLSTAVASALALGALAPAAQAEVSLSGNIGVVSDYVLRGITAATESDGPAVQGGFDMEHSSGFYAGYWASSLGYGSDNLTTTVENDFYAGFAGSAGEFSYDIGAIYYYYMDDSDASGGEFVAGIGWGPVTLGMKYLLQDVTWGNEGDIYWTLGMELPVPSTQFTFSAVAGYYTYEDSGKYIPSTEKSGAFRHLDLSLSHPIGDSGADMFITYVVGGDDRGGVDQKDKIVLGLTYGFDL